MMEQLALFTKPPEGHLFTDYTRLKEFVLAGKAKITIQSKPTTKHYTFKIKAGSSDTWYVHRLGPDNTYIYLGTIFERDGFKATRKTTPANQRSEQFKAFDWFWKAMTVGKRIPSTIDVYHEGRCGMCGVELTDPISVREGYGPDCRKKRFRRPFVCEPIEKAGSHLPASSSRGS